MLGLLCFAKNRRFAGQTANRCKSNSYKGNELMFRTMFYRGWAAAAVFAAAALLTSAADAGWWHGSGGGSSGGSSGGWGGSSGGGGYWGASGGWGSSGGGGHRWFHHHRRHRWHGSSGGWGGSSGGWGGSSGGYGHASSGGGSSGGSSGGGYYYAPMEYAPMKGSIPGDAPAAPMGDVPPEAPPAGEETSIDKADGLLAIEVPADAKIFVNGQATRSTGEHREFVSRDLELGYNYAYEVRAEVIRDGQTIEQTKKIDLRAGKRAEVAFNFAPAEKVETKLTVRVPADAKVYLSGNETSA